MVSCATPRARCRARHGMYLVPAADEAIGALKTALSRVSGDGRAALCSVPDRQCASVVCSNSLIQPHDLGMFGLGGVPTFSSQGNQAQMLVGQDLT